jgi:hypothetical protein
MTTETMNQTNTHFPIDSLSIPNVIYTSHVPLIPSDLSTQSIEDLACNMINVKATCKGSLQIATIPPQADIYIYEEIHGDYILRTEKTGTMISPSVITDIECTGPTRSNKFKLTLTGYVDVEGILDITDGTIYQLYIIMEKCAITEFGGGGFLIPALAIGGLMFLLLGGDKTKHKFEDYDKYKEIYE